MYRSTRLSAQLLRRCPRDRLGAALRLHSSATSSVMKDDAATGVDAAAASVSRRVPGYKVTRTPATAGAPISSPGPSVSACAEDKGPVAPRPLTALQKRQLAMKDKQAFSLTNTALHRIRILLDKHNNATQGPKAIGIRVGVKRRGCSGYSYTLNYAFEQDPNIKPGDTHVEQNGIHIYVDHSALFYVIGTVMNFVTSNVEEKFTFQNPNKTAECGCQESFMV